MPEIRGRRCQVCIGCGRCGEVPTDLHVVTESFLKPEVKAGNMTSNELEISIESDSSAESGEARAISAEGDFVIVDIGTTTIAMELYDAVGQKKSQYVSPNPQRIFGADVISRIRAAENVMQQRQMQSLVKSVLEEGIKEFQKLSDTIEQIYIAGNTTMMYLLNGYEVQPLGYAPFQADFLQREELLIGGIKAMTLPGLSAFVGGDIVAGILATGIHRRQEIGLLIDLGTNGEMVLGNQDKMIACSSAAGPAFEGMLQNAAKAVWGADIVDIAAELLKQGIIDETGLLQDEYFEKGVTVAGVPISQAQIRQLQTAKAAIAAGVQMMVEKYGLESAADIDRVYLAGGFGYFLKEQSAITIGLLPEKLKGKVVAAGNTSLAGAYYYHYAQDAELETEQIRHITRVINLAETEGFSELFVENMYLKQV